MPNTRTKKPKSIRTKRHERLGTKPVQQTRPKRSHVLNPDAEGLTIHEIIKHSNTRARRDAAEVSIKGRRNIKIKGIVSVQYKTETHGVTTGGRETTREHTVTITPTELKEGKGVILDCDCEDFLYGGVEYALAWRGAARIRRGNGKAPVQTYPQYKRTYFVCKHILRALASERKHVKK